MTDMHAVRRLDLSNVPLNFITLVFRSMSHKERFTCALVCKAWAGIATAATSSIILRHSQQDVSSLQRWLEKHGSQVKVLQLDARVQASLAALPCPQLQDLLLHGYSAYSSNMKLSSRVWDDIAAATKLTSVSLQGAHTDRPQLDVVSALTALPDLKRFAWRSVKCNKEQQLSESLLLQHLTELTSLELVRVSAEALQHLGSLVKLQHFSIAGAEDWFAAGCPGLQELTALTRLHFVDNENELPGSISQLTALRQLCVSYATFTTLHGLQALTGLTQLRVQHLDDSPPASALLPLPGLQQLQLVAYVDMPMSFLASCTRLQVLRLSGSYLKGPGTLVASTILQDLVLNYCSIPDADGAAGPDPWQQVFPGPGRLPHLTALKLPHDKPDLQQTDMERVVACCSNLQVLHLDTLEEGFAPALLPLSALTTLCLSTVKDQHCGALAKLTGLSELRVGYNSQLSAAGLRQLTALEQLTSLGSTSVNLSPVLQEQMTDVLDSCTHAIVNQVRAGVRRKGERETRASARHNTLERWVSNLWVAVAATQTE